MGGADPESLLIPFASTASMVAMLITVVGGRGERRGRGTRKGNRQRQPEIAV